MQTADTNTTPIMSGDPGELKMLPIGELHESPLNPRTYFAEGPLQELAESIRASGVHNPLIVRPRIEGGGFEIGAGHRRFRAAKRAGVALVPVVIRDLTDLQFIELLAFENGNREGLHPLEEAAGWRTYLRETLSDVSAIQQKTGYSQSQVYSRLKLLEAIDEAQRACWDGKIKAGHLQLIAVLDPKDQEKALRACEPPEWDETRTVSVRDLKAWIKKNLHLDLTEAPFAAESSDLVPAAGACTVCPHRVANLPDFNPTEDIPDVCTRPACYAEKVAAFIEVEKIRIKSETGDLICVSERGGARKDDVLPPADWRRANAFTVGAKQALVVEGPSAGHVITVVVQERIPYTPPAAPPPSPKKPGVSKEERERQAVEQKRQAELRKQEEAKRQKEREEAEAKLEAEKRIRRSILEATLQKVQWPPKRQEIVDLLDDVVCEVPEVLDDLVSAQGAKPGARGLSMLKLTELQVARLVVIHAVSRDFDDYVIGRGMDRLKDLASRYGVDAAAIRKQASAVKDVIHKLPTLDGSKKTAPPKKAAPKKASAKKQPAKKGGKK